MSGRQSTELGEYISTLINPAVALLEEMTREDDGHIPYAILGMFEVVRERLLKLAELISENYDIDVWVRAPSTAWFTDIVGISPRDKELGQESESADRGNED